MRVVSRAEATSREECAKRKRKGGKSVKRKRGIEKRKISQGGQQTKVGSRANGRVYTDIENKEIKCFKKPVRRDQGRVHREKAVTSEQKARGPCGQKRLHHRSDPVKFVQDKNELRHRLKMPEENELEDCFLQHKNWCSKISGIKKL